MSARRGWVLQTKVNNDTGGDHDVDQACDLAVKMMSHDTLYNLANSLGVAAMLTVVLYHVVAVNAKHLEAHSGTPSGPQ
ncbi:hypothetical protein OBBRIDRAFT_836372 [Obba rivulosa]|uniref:Dolichyl-diphosphooligosaccharide--protein glycosyltransferase subunit 4 n=1 Tax=Obba rivulosa TaxID=1052685 RepID=A0A8E2AV99_9APHY|nr:hypothetical protein OBBRIDRAFT_836372 [Obba rivulosa]